VCVAWADSNQLQLLQITCAPSLRQSSLHTTILMTDDDQAHDHSHDHGHSHAEESEFDRVPVTGGVPSHTSHNLQARQS
jgi:hypothetical protein